MDKNVEISMLLDYYSPLLTEKQHNIIDLYYNCDYSLREIADNLEISRQGVRDTLKRAEEILLSAEDKLGFAVKMDRIREDAKKIENLADKVRVSVDSSELKSELDSIINIATSLQKD